MTLEDRVKVLEEQVKELIETTPTPEKLQKLREQANLSIKFAAMIIGISAKIYQLFENGEREIPREIYLKAATSFGKSKYC